MTARFAAQGFQDRCVAFVKKVTSKPVVGVGRCTSPDAMAALVRSGALDFIGAARPSIADPFLPRKIEEGRPEDIRACIGCNVCCAGDTRGVPIRCTQNPAMGEEWRRGWHPERVPPRRSAARVLVVGAGPAGLEAARVLGLGGCAVTLAEATRRLGGRIPREAALPGMNAYLRVRDYREGQLARLPNVEVFRESRLTAEDVCDLAPDHAALATGADWRADRWDGRAHVPVATGGAAVLTADDVMDGRLPEGPAVVFDGDGYNLAAAIAELLCKAGRAVTYVTPSDSLADWAANTAERWRMRTRLMQLGVGIVTGHALTAFDGAAATLVCRYTAAGRTIPAGGVVMVTQRLPRDGLRQALRDRAGGAAGGLPFTLARIGDCAAPGLVAAAVHAGHRYGVELESPAEARRPARHERPSPAAAPAR